jgi:hypothetical protein
MSKISVMIGKDIWDKYKQEIKKYVPFGCPDNTIDELTEVFINIVLAKDVEKNLGAHE